MKSIFQIFCRILTLFFDGLLILFLYCVGNVDHGNMSQKLYWDKFYSKHNQSSFEWLIDHRDLNDQIDLCESEQPSEHHTQILLDIGCGSSIFSHKLRKNGSPLLICADFSQEALALLRNKHTELDVNANNQNRQRQYVDYVQCDCRYLPFRDDLFDLVIDKGFLDSLLKTNLDSSKAMLNASTSMRSILEKLATNGRLVQITDEEPDLRSSLLDELLFKYNCNFSYSFKEFEVENKSSTFYYFYFIEKNI